MQNLIQLIYASRASVPATQRSLVEKDLGRILLQSRVNNAKQQIGGVLYCGNGYFFQCLEGSQHTVNQLYNKIINDSRHFDSQTLSVKRIQRRRFANWSMKYVPVEARVSQLLREYGLQQFEPYAFHDELIDRMMHLFVSIEDPTEHFQHNDNVNRQQVQQKQTTSVGWFARIFKRREKVDMIPS